MLYYRQLHHEIRLPDIECLNCTIQLMREAGEWGAGVCNGGKYDFYTCADVDIVKCEYHTVKTE